MLDCVSQCSPRNVCVMSFEKSKKHIPVLHSYFRSSFDGFEIPRQRRSTLWIAGGFQGSGVSVQMDFLYISSLRSNLQNRYDVLHSWQVQPRRSFIESLGRNNLLRPGEVICCRDGFSFVPWA